MTRSRTRTTLYPPGTRTRFNDPVNRGIVYSLSETCQDEVLSGDNFAFTVNRTTMRGGVINSDYDGGYFVATFRNYAADALTNGQLNPDYSFPDALPDAAYASQAVNRTSPNKPYVDIGVNVLEFGDCIRLVHEWGKDLIRAGKGREKVRIHSGNVLRDLGKGNLTYGFGIAPVVGDLIKLMNFRDQVDRRVKIIERLKSSKGLRKTVDLTSLSKTTSQSVVWQSADVYLSSNVDRMSAQNIRGHCRWIPTTDLSKLSSRDLEAMAKRAVTGMTIDFSTLWEIVPFSWLIDYGTNVGQYIQNQRNIVPAFLDSVVLIKHSVTRYEVPVLRSGQHEMSRGHVIFERKQRYPVNADITAYFPFLSGSQMGILASLAVTRR